MTFRKSRAFGHWSRTDAPNPTRVRGHLFGLEAKNRARGPTAKEEARVLPATSRVTRDSVPLMVMMGLRDDWRLLTARTNSGDQESFEPWDSKPARVLFWSHLGRVT